MQRILTINARGFLLRALFALSSLAVITAAIPAIAPAQNNQWAVQRAQEAVRDKIWREQGGSNSVDVTFPDWFQPETYFVSNAQTGVRGRGAYARRNNYTNQQLFSYDVVLNNRNGRVDRVDYSLENGPGNSGESGSGVERPSFGVPDWLFGAYRGRNPASGEKLNLFIGRNGNARASYDNGTTDRGSYQNGFIRFGRSLSWEVNQSGKDLRIRDPRTGKTERLRRTSDNAGGGDGGNWNPGGGGGNWNNGIPNWAIGTFRGETTAGESELTIFPDGTATARSMNNNVPFNGRVSNGVLTFNWGSFDLVQDGNGIMTRDRANRRNETRYKRVREPR